MSGEANKALVRRAMEDGFNTGNLALMDELFLPNYVRHEAGGPGVRSLAEHKAELASRRVTFPDGRFTIDDMIAEGERVAVRYTMTGTQRGAYRGIAPTGRTISRASSAFFRIEGGKIAEGWLVSDLYGVLHQLGAEPAAGA